MSRLRPLSLGSIFDEAFDLYRQNFLFLLLINVAVGVPVLCVLLFLPHLFPGLPTMDQVYKGVIAEFFPAYFFTPTTDPFLSRIPAVFIFVRPLGQLIAAVALTIACSRAYHGKSSSIELVFRVPYKRFFPMLTTAFWFFLINIIGMFFCYIGFFVTLAYTVFVAQVFTVEDLRNIKALQRSKKLVGPRMMNVLGFLIVLYIIVAILAIGLQLPIQYALDTIFNITPNANMIFGGADRVLLQNKTYFYSLQLSQTIAEMIVTPFSFAALTVFYYDLRVRHEAYDITLLAHELEYPTLKQLKDYLPPYISQP